MNNHVSPEKKSQTGGPTGGRNNSLCDAGDKKSKKRQVSLVDNDSKNSLFVLRACAVSRYLNTYISKSRFY